MTFRQFNRRYLEPGSMLVMVLGIAALCQPWIAVLHQWSVLTMIVGLIVYNVSVHVPPPEPAKGKAGEPGPEVASLSGHEAVHG